MPSSGLSREDFAGAPLIAIVGPTASGKSAWAAELAEAAGSEIVGADSRQVYRGLDIGTAKPAAAERARIPHHCVDQIDPRERYHVARYLREAGEAIAGIQARGRRPLLVGGTGQYVWALLEGWDVPEVAPDDAFRGEMQARAEREGAEALHTELAQTDPVAAAAIPAANVRRVIRALEVQRASGRPISAWHEARAPLPVRIVAPEVEREELGARIDSRVEEMFAAGLVGETQALLEAGVPPDAPGFDSVGYREVVRYLAGELPLEACVAAVKRSTRRLAKKQRAWFRRDDTRIQWCGDVAAARAVLLDG